MPAVTRAGPPLTRAALLLLCLLALRGDACPERLPVTVTAYASGTVTASGRRPQPGMLALSRDVERALGVRFGDRVQLAGLGTYTFQDRMPRRWTRRVDLYLPSRHAARQFGKQRGTAWRVAPLTAAAGGADRGSETTGRAGPPLDGVQGRRWPQTREPRPHAR